MTARFLIQKSKLSMNSSLFRSKFLQIITKVFFLIVWLFYSVSADMLKILSITARIV